jgi:hypothetical protein
LPQFALTQSPAPFARNLAVGPLQEVFDFLMLSYTFGGEPAGTYTWFTVLTPRGADPWNMDNWLSWDDASFTKN